MMTPLPLGITLALSLTCGSMPLLAQGSYMPGPMPATAGTKQDPTDMYLEALRLVTQAAGLVEKRDYIGAIRLTQQAEDKFGRLAKSYPQWRPNLLQTRRQLNRENLDQWQKLAHTAKHWRFEGLTPCSWKQAQTTGGGLALREVDQHFQFKGCPGLYFVGETLDCAGSCGGFNLHWAFGSGLVAGRSAAGHAAAGRALPKASAPAKSRKKPHR